MNRLTAMKQVLEHYPHQPTIANCGATARELASLGRKPNHFYILDAMGIASSVGVGVALAVADTQVERVIVFEGDGALLMNLGSLASIGYHQPEKLLLVVLDNESYASTGGQTTYAARVDLGAIAAAAGVETLLATSEAELDSCLDTIAQLKGPICLHIKIEPGNALNIPLLLEDPAIITHTFMTWLNRTIGRKIDD